MKDSQQSLLNQSTKTSEPWELRGGVLRIPNYHFSEGPNVRGGAYSLKRVPHYCTLLSMCLMNWSDCEIPAAGLEFSWNIIPIITPM